MRLVAGQTAVYRYRRLMERTCPNGHPVHRDESTYCPYCEAPLAPPMQATQSLAQTRFVPGDRRIREGWAYVIAGAVLELVGAIFVGVATEASTTMFLLAIPVLVAGTALFIIGSVAEGVRLGLRS